MTTVGHVDNFRYFLPRIVELATEGAFLVEREVVFSKIRYGRWHEWPPHEREAVDRFAQAIAEGFATTDFDEWELDEWVCALGQFVDDLPALLAPLLSGTAVARANLARLVELNREALREEGELINAFWTDSPNRSAFLDWLERPEVRFAAG
jgi:hypothetical protein